MPVDALLALLLNGHCLLAGILQLCSANFERYLGRLVGVEIVVNYAGQGDRVALRDEPRRLEPHDHIFARNDFVFCCANFCIGRYATRRCAPGSQVVRQFYLDCGPAIGARNDVRLPERGVFEILANRRLDQVTFIFEIGKLIRRLVFGKVHWLVAGKACEGIGDREMGFDAIVAQTVKLALDVARIIRSNAVDRFIDHAQAYFRAGYRCAFRVASEDGVRRRLARLVLILV